MGKGDKKTRRGKIFKGSRGNTRRLKTNKSTEAKKSKYNKPTKKTK